MRIAGIVLCGGQSRRMGRSKAWMPYGDELMLPRVVRILASVVDPVVVVAAPDQELPTLPTEVEIVRDERSYLGPLNGLATGLSHLGDRVDAVYLSACDVPLLRPAFVRRVLDRLGETWACVPEVAGFKHPLAAAFRREVLPDAREMLAADELRITALLERIATHILTIADFAEVDPELQSLQNVNVWTDYEAVLRLQRSE